MSRVSVAWSGILIALVVSTAPVAKSEDLPKSATVLDPDCIFYSWPYPTISPDGNWVAYVSKGHVCVCNIKAPEPLQIMEVSHSWTWPHFVVGAGNSSSTGSYPEFRELSRDQRNELMAQLTNRIYGVIWTHNSAAFVFGVQRYDAEKKASTSDTYLASVKAAVTKLAHIDPDTPTRGLVAGTLTRDRKFLVSSGVLATPGVEKPLLWNVAANKPRATCFLYLTPSATSGRWIGIEKDTRQLVIVDEDFQVTRRFDATRPERTFGFRLNWSPDERCIIWRNQVGFDHYSNWEGFHMNLDTGAKRELHGRFMDEQIEFTGRGGEFYRCGQTGAKTRGYDTVVGAHLTIVPENDGAAFDLWRIDVDPKGPKPGLLTNRPGNPPLRMSPDGSLFAIGLPRPAGERSGVTWHLINREGKTWRFPGEDNGEFVSPYQLAGFADNGETVIAYDATRLFAIPVATVKNEVNEINE
ncbi:MAG: hypothetical protein WD851_11055 [Pirellulales bacterium]